MEDVNILGKHILDNATKYDEAEVRDKAVLWECAVVRHDAQIYGNARVGGYAVVEDEARVFGNAHVYGHARVGEYAVVEGEARIGGKAVILGGTWDGSEGEILEGTWIAPGVPYREPGDKFKLRHADHGLSGQQIDWVFAQCRKKSEGFHVFAEPLPDDIGEVSSALYGPEAGDPPVGEDEVVYEKRGKRPGPSRLIARLPRPATHMVIVVLVKSYSERLGIAATRYWNEYVVFTAYGTQASRPTPREWWDTSMKPHEAVEAAKFWSEHALAR